MEIRENKGKKILLPVLGIIVLVVTVIGVSFAAYNVTFDSNTANSISTGTIMVSYTEPTNAISILDAMPLEDSEGVKLTGTNNTFDFTVSTHASNALTIPYTISLTKVAGNTLLDSEVKVHLTKDEKEVVAPTKVSTLVANTRENSVTLYSTNDVFTTTGQEAKTTSYVLRMWVDKDVTVDASTQKIYKAKVNVDSAVTPIA